MPGVESVSGLQARPMPAVIASTNRMWVLVFRIVPP